MRHRKIGRKFGRNSSHRKAMFSNMVVSLFRHERIETTDAKAKEIRPLAEHLITLAKRGASFARAASSAVDPNDRRRLNAASIHKRRLAATVVRDPEVLAKLFGPLQDRYRERPGGYTRIIKLGPRKGDGAPMSVIELVDREVPPPSVSQETGKGKEEKEARA